MSDAGPTLYVVKNSQYGEACVSERQPLDSRPLAVDGWRVKTIEAAGMEVSVYTVAPQAVYGSHAVPFDSVCYVAEGVGELFLTDAAGKELSAVLCRKGDSYVQGTNALHGFRNGSEETVLVYVRVV